MEAKLPDVNAGIVTHRKAVMNGYDNKNFHKVATSFDAIISLLPDDYKPTINTEQYFEKIKGRRSLICDVCTTLDDKGVGRPTQHTRETIIPYEMLLSNEDQFLLGVVSCLVWTCSKCFNTRPLVGSNAVNEEFQQPFYTGIMPEMPVRRGLHDRIGYIERFNSWYRVAFREIEYKIGLYRAEYQKQNPDEVIPNMDDA